MTASVCSWFVNVITALFFAMDKTFSDIMKKLIHRSFDIQKIAFKNKKNNNAFKVKNDNGPISFFICYCSTSR